MPVTYIGLITTFANSSGGTSNTVDPHSREQAGHVEIQAWWLPTEVTELTPNTDGWSFLLQRDLSTGPFALWLAWRVSRRESTRWDWRVDNRMFGGNKLIVDAVDTEYPFQVGPLHSGATAGQTLTLPSMTPPEAGGMAVHWLTARYASGTSSKSIGTVSGHTMSSAQSSSHSGDGHALRFARRDNVPANTATGTASTTATATTTGWRVLSGVLREPRPWSPQNKQFHTHA